MIHYGMLQQFSDSSFMSVVTAYCHIYGVSSADLIVPSMKTSMSGVKLNALLQEIQRQWVSAATGREWSFDEFVNLCFTVGEWLEKCPEYPAKDDDWDLWFAGHWKRSAELILGLNAKGE